MGAPIDRSLDCLGLFCPMPVLKAREALGALDVGQTLEVLSDDPGSEADMVSWTSRTGHTLLEIGKDGGVFRFVLRKTR